jgi:hypothetical protein
MEHGYSSARRNKRELHAFLRNSSCSRDFMHTQSWVLQFEKKNFDQFIQAILEYQEKQTVICNVEAFFEFTHDGSATVVRFPPRLRE